jgi:membrane protein implicated in regulation of membrane protease activity
MSATCASVDATKEADVDVVTQYAWIIWIALVLLFVVVEVTTLELTFLMLAVGGLGGLLADLFGAPWWLQIVVAAVIAVLLLFTVRPPLLRALGRGGDPTPSNVEALLGLRGTVVVPLSPDGGQVKLSNGDTWTARLLLAGPGSEKAAVAAPSAPVLDTGSPVVVTAIEGSTALVVPA